MARGDKVPKGALTSTPSAETAAATAKSAPREIPTIQVLAPIARPLADDKLKKKVLKLAKKATKQKSTKRGVKEVVKALRKQAEGLCVMAGDISPIDVITHLPVFCEDRYIPYVFVPSKEELGAAGLTKRPTSCMLILPKAPKGASEDVAEYTTTYQDVLERVKAVQPLY